MIWEKLKKMFSRSKPLPMNKTSRQQRRKLKRDLMKLQKKVSRKAEQTLKDPKIPRWIREVKRSQLTRNGLLD